MMSFAAAVIVKATLVSGVAFLLARMCRRSRASLRHLLFALAFAALMAIPVAGAIVPAVPVMLPAAALSPDARPEAAVPTPPSVYPRSSGGNGPVIAETSPSAWPLTIPQILVVLWAIGVAVFLAPVLAGFWQVSRVRRTATPWTGGQELVQSLALARGVRRRIDLVLHEAVAGPMTCCVMRPSIILPVMGQDWDEASLRRSLRHELEHVARWDVLTNGLSRIVCAVYWFHPLVWAAWRRLRLEAEKACDDAVVLEDDARDYASLLVSMAQPAASGLPPLLAMASRDDLTARVAALLDRTQARGPVGRRLAAGLIVIAAAAVFGVAPITVARAMPQAQVTSPAPSPTFADASIKRLPPTQLRQIDGRIVATGVTAQNLLMMAFAVRGIENAPPWVRMERFDIVADAPANSTPAQRSMNLQALLAERFKLVAHQETRDFPVYALVLARPDGRLGPQISPSQMDCSRRDSIRARAVNGVEPAPAAQTLPNCSTTSSDGRMAGGGVTLEEFARNLPTHLRFYGTQPLFARPLLDRTGLTGRFDFRMEWEQDVSSSAAAESGLESQAPRFLAALRQQLGLTIESQMAPAPVLVIDSIEPPAEN
jgi:bla regulator protein blaR1